MFRQMTYLPAILWVLLSTALWTLIFAAAKLADGAVGTLQLTLLRYVGGLLTVIWLVRGDGGFAAHRSRQPLTHFLRAVCGGGAAVVITWGSAHMPLANATAIGMTYGVLLILLGVVFLGERPGRAHLWAVALSLVGVTVVLLGRGAFHQALPVWPALAAFAGALLLAVEGLLIRLLGLRERPVTVMLYVSFFGLCLIALPAWLTWQKISLSVALVCIGLGPVAVFAQYCTIRGYRAAPLSVVGPVDYSWLLFAALLGFVAFGERPDAATLAGCALIIAGGVLLARAR